MIMDGLIGMDVVFKQADGLMANDLDGDTVLMSVESGAYYGLEATGQAIWTYLAQPILVADLVDCLLERYEVDRALCEKQVVAFLGKLEGEGLIQRCTQA
jgi:hypothetical protein